MHRVSSMKTGSKMPDFDFVLQLKEGEKSDLP